MREHAAQDRCHLHQPRGAHVGAVVEHAPDHGPGHVVGPERPCQAHRTRPVEQPRRYDPRADRRDMHIGVSLRAQLQLDGLGEPDHAPLAGTVRRPSGRAAVAGEARDVDQVRVGTVDQVREEGMREDHRTLEVHRQGRQVPVQWHVQEVAAEHCAGIVHQDVDRSAVGVDPLTRGRNVTRVGDVEPVLGHITPRIPQGGRRLCEQRFVDIGEHDPRSRGGGALRDRVADPGGAPGDEDALVRQCSHADLPIIVTPCRPIRPRYSRTPPGLACWAPRRPPGGSSATRRIVRNARTRRRVLPGGGTIRLGADDPGEARWPCGPCVGRHT